MCLLLVSIGLFRRQHDVSWHTQYHDTFYTLGAGPWWPLLHMAYSIRIVYCLWSITQGSFLANCFPEVYTDGHTSHSKLSNNVCRLWAGEEEEMWWGRRSLVAMYHHPITAALTMITRTQGLRILRKKSVWENPGRFLVTEILSYPHRQ